jgi:hypothetical protein
MLHRVGYVLCSVQRVLCGVTVLVIGTYTVWLADCHLLHQCRICRYLLSLHVSLHVALSCCADPASSFNM